MPRLRKSTQRQKDAVGFCEEILKITFEGNIESFTECHNFLSIYLDDAIRKLDNLTKLKDKKYSIYKNANDYDKQIYIEKKLFKWSNAKISANHNGIGKSQIYRIVEKIEDRKVGEKRGK